MAAEGEAPAGTHQRIDKWLFFARMVKSRAIAQALVEAGSVTINGRPIRHASDLVRPGDKVGLLFERRDVLLVVRSGGFRRGPSSEARQLYDDLSPPVSEQARLTPFERALRRPLHRGKDGN
ncbi:MAG: RNA-binding S4 domain-containing protein [Pseudomonadota bacterium]|nr:RNA-binding S4 domain-containing protein [Pseudomonadota bacterium]